MKIKNVLLVITMLCPIFGFAASFDCQKAAQPDEKAICANHVLNDLDVEMATKYQFLRGLFAMGTRGTMQDDQRAWLKNRSQCGNDASCLKNVYQQRITQLDAVYAGIDKPL